MDRFKIQLTSYEDLGNVFLRAILLELCDYDKYKGIKTFQKKPSEKIDDFLKQIADLASEYKCCIESN